MNKVILLSACLILSLLTFYVPSAYAQEPEQICGPNPATAFWKQTAPLSSARSGIATAGTDTHIYAIGGYFYSRVYQPHQSPVWNYTFTPLNVGEYAAINADGSLKQWQPTPPLNVARYDAGAVVTGTHIYVVGGGTETNNTSVEFAKINPDGSLSPWKLTTPFNETAIDLDLFVSGDYLYATGLILPDPTLPPASTIPGYMDDIEGPPIFKRTLINPDGSLGPWETLTAPTFSMGLDEVQSVFVNDYIYIVANISWGNPSLEVRRVNIQANGTVGAWESVSTPTLLKRHYDVAAVGNNIFTIGGYLTSIDWTTRSPINPDGSLGNWDIANRLTVRRLRLSVVSVGKYIYALGGHSNACCGAWEHPTLTVVEYWDATKPPAPDHYGISINDGALFTNNISVTLTIGEVPPWSDKIQISNDGGFAGAVWEDYVSCKPWQITQYGNYVIPRTVYIRFQDSSGNVTATYQDDIILDVTSPTGSVEIVNQVTPAANPQVNLMDVTSSGSIFLPLIVKRNNSPNVTLRIKATDDVTGVAEMMISERADFVGANWESYVSSKSRYLPLEISAIYVKFKDHAGNVSPVVTGVVNR